MIRAVVFDFGGVMTASATPALLKELTDSLGLPWRIFADGFAAHRLDYDRGTATVEEMYARIFADAGIELPKDSLKRIYAADTASWLRRNDRTRDWMARLKARGFKIGILTNMAPGFAPLFREHYADFVALADAMVISGEERLVKPMPEIYALLQRRIALAPDELCFVDDLAMNCDAARACGWQAVRFTDNDQAERNFERLLAIA